VRAYNLSFISDENLYKHVRETIEKYKFRINLKEFNKNLIDPIKLTFDAKVYGKSIEEIIDLETVEFKSNISNIAIKY